MIQMRVGEAGKQLILLGISDENWERMRRQNQPILVRSSSPVFDGIEGLEIALVAGPDEESIRARLSEYFDLPATEQT